MHAVTEVTGNIRPNLQQLVDYLEQAGDPQPLGFFQSMLEQLDKVSEEDELLELFMLLSTTAFQGFVLDPMAALMADRILAYAHEVSHAFSADEETRH